MSEPQAMKDMSKAEAGRLGGLAKAERARERKAQLSGPLDWSSPEAVHESLAKVADRLAAGAITARDATALHKLANGMLAALKISYTARLEEIERQMKDQAPAHDTGVRRRRR